MARIERPRGGPRLSLRTKLLALSLILLIIPWIGYHYVNETETLLRQHKEQALLATAGAVARVLHDQPALFRHGGTHLQAAEQPEHLYVRGLPTPIQLDGYGDDWDAYRDRARRYGDPDHGTWFDLLPGTRDGYLFALLEVHDDRLIYREPGSEAPADGVRVALLTPAGTLRRYTLSSTSPGWVSAQPDREVTDTPAPPDEGRIRGEWQETLDGYTLELRIPLTLIGERLSFAVVDVDQPQQRRVETTVATAGLDQPDRLGTITVPTATVDRLLQGLERQQGRVWIVDAQQRVLAMAGSLARDDDRQPPDGLLRGLYRLLLGAPAEELRDDLSDVSRLRSPEVSAALAGQPTTRWRRTADQRVSIVSATYPVWVGDRVIGAAVAEETSRDILLLQNRALERLLNLSVLTFLAGAVLLLFLAGRIAGRVRRLRDQAEQAIAGDGRVVGTIAPSRSRDEIGDLSRSFADLLERLRHYTGYLETMAGKLSHELRTPIAVVRSSLDNLDQAGVSPAQHIYTQRARAGLERLDGIVSRMSEASRLEQAFQQMEPETFDLAELLRGCVAGYRGAHPQRRFDLVLGQQPLPMVGVPDLMAQLLDKLVSNALDFGDPDQPVVIEATTGERLVLRVRNQGPPLPADMEASLFDSMVCVRAGRSDEPHLGLGLYIVRLIAQYHGGEVQARSTHGPEGAEFTVVLPPADRASH